MTTSWLPSWTVTDIIRRGGRLVGGTGRRFVRLDEEGLLAAAQRRTRLADFGDLAFRDPLQRLLHSLETEARLNLVGRVAAREDITRVLVNRLELQRDRQQYPGIAAEEIRRPLFITGMPRSGSTLLHGLLAQDPANRVPLNWETLHPSPPPEWATHETDRRIERAEREIRWFSLLAPQFRKIHPVGARLPEECVVILSHAFLSFQFSSTYFVPSYQSWLEQQDLSPAYRFHRQFLQHLQWRCGSERWVLKAPPHLPGLRALFTTYPDAGVIMTHRDPLEVVASVASLHTVLRQTFSDAVDPLQVGPEVAGLLAGDIRRGLQVLDSGCLPADRLLNVTYTPLIADPLAVVRRIYAQFDLPLTAAVEARMQRFLAEHPRDRDGHHEYSLQQFGLDADRERERFRTYRERFGL
ncbi:MAG TPA: sulfotransferase [Candidatus Margulisiibacteriota bacterium]|nr:sulfotransferase [Candidatus Margulisiibacteriota bacterium]